MCCPLMSLLVFFSAHLVASLFLKLGISHQLVIAESVTTQLSGKKSMIHET